MALRIVEYEASGLNFNKSANPSIANRYSGGTSKASVELWDVSGHVRYQSCWPAIMKDANGVLTCSLYLPVQLWQFLCQYCDLMCRCCLGFGEFVERAIGVEFHVNI